MADGDDRIKDTIRRGLDAGASLSKMSRRELEEKLHDLMQSASPAKERLEDVLEEVRARSMRASAALGDMVRAEVRKEIDLAARRRREGLADLVEHAADLFVEFVGTARRQRPPADAEESAEESAEAPSLRLVGEDAAKKAAAKKTAGNKAAGKKAAGKKAAAKKAGAKKTPAEKAAPKKAATKKAAAKKAGAKKAPAAGKKAAAKKAARPSPPGPSDTPPQPA